MSMDASKDEIDELAGVLQVLGKTKGRDTYLRTAVVTAVSGATATITLGAGSIPGVPFYRSAVPIVGDTVEVLFDGTSPRIVGVFADAQRLYAPGLVKIAEIGPIGAIQTFDFTNIPQTFSHLKLVGSSRQGTNGGVLARINPGVGPQSYDNVSWSANRGASALAMGSAVNEGFAYIYGSTGDAGGFPGYTNFETTFFDYAQTRPHHVVTQVSGGTDDNIFAAGSATRIYDQTPISRILLNHGDASGFGIGSHITLYGMT